MIPLKDNKINVLFVDSGCGFGGSTSYLYSFLKYMDRDIFNPKVLFYKYAAGATVKKIKDLGIEILSLEAAPVKISGTSGYVGGVDHSKLYQYLTFVCKFFISDVHVIVRIIGILRRDKIAVVFFGSDVNSNVNGILAAKLAGRLCVVRKSGGSSELNGMIMRSILSRFVDIFIASSNAEANEHKKRGYKSNAMHMIYEGVDLDYFKPRNPSDKIRKEFGILSGQTVIGYISRIDVGKGQGDFIEAANLVLKKYPSTVFLLIGDDVDFKDGLMKKQLIDKVRKLNIEARVCFTGWRDDILDILHTLDIFVHCPNSWREGMGIATLEALACGKPTIVTDNWGLAETAEDNYTGYVVPIGDYVSLSERIIALIRNKEQLRAMGKNARSFCELKFDIKKNVLKTESILLGNLSHK